jgi:putative hydrolase of the HAD superfamily
MRQDIDAIAFDIDGTLYPDWALHVRMGPFLVRYAKFLAEFGQVRREIRDWQDAHPGEAHADFFGWQAELLARRIRSTTADAREMIRTLIYDGWRPVFARIKPYPHLLETFTAMKAAGLKIGILSDFPPSQKNDLWGLVPLCDAILGAEEAGALKPSPVPFLALSAALGVPCERILYVGNSIRSDIEGATAVGMKTAFIATPVAAFFGRKAPSADISFPSYRHLTRVVLK